MASVFTGVLLKVEKPRIKGGDVTFAEMTFQTVEGQVVTWKDISMDRKVADVLRLQQPVTLYLSPMMSSLFGVRSDHGPGVFQADSASILFLLMAIGMVFLGLGTSMFVFPLLVSLAGAIGVVMHFLAARAKRRFRRDEKRAARSGATHA